MMHLVFVGLFVPLAGFLVLSLKGMGRHLTARVASGTILFSFLSFLALLLSRDSFAPQVVTLFNWLPVEGIAARFALQVDGLSLLMALIITGVGFLIHVYSAGYMDHEKDYRRYFAFLNFFIFAMLLLVLSSNLLLLFVGWEGVGLASYLLIGFWYERPSAAKAATKAFVVNRIGDLGLLLGLLLTFSLFGTSEIMAVCEKAAVMFPVGAPVVTLLCLLFFIGAVGKSAQVPLHVWLPDAMEGPTPVSALIHAATMVTAGVYLVVRLHPLFVLAPAALYTVALVGTVTAIFAATIGTAQVDLKRVLAYSTVSQLGLMFLACGVGAFYAAMFHLMTHAFIKALLFLSAGNVVHMMHGETSMEKMGGLSRVFKKTHWLFLIGVLALSGVPPLAAFFSKDLLLDQAHHHGYYYLFYVGLAVSVLTAFYLMRAYLLTFKQERSSSEEIQEAPPVMVNPLYVLAFLSLVGGLIGYSFFGKSGLEALLMPVFQKVSIEHFEWGFLTLLSVLAAVAGLGIAGIFYGKRSRAFGKEWVFLKRAYYMDDIYQSLIVTPLRGVARAIARVVEPAFFEGMMQGMAVVVNAVGGLLAKAQNGQIRSYAAWLAIGAAFLLVFLVF